MNNFWKFDREGEQFMKNIVTDENMIQLVHTRDQGSVNDVENPRIVISQEIQNETIRQETGLWYSYTRLGWFWLMQFPKGQIVDTAYFTKEG